jgi:hypothetical protein
MKRRVHQVFAQCRRCRVTGWFSVRQVKRPCKNNLHDYCDGECGGMLIAVLPCPLADVDQLLLPFDTLISNFPLERGNPDEASQ